MIPVGGLTHYLGDAVALVAAEDMETVERQKEDVPFDMECYQDEEGHVYDFGFGMDYNGTIEDERVRRYGADRNGHTHQQ